MPFSSTLSSHSPPALPVNPASLLPTSSTTDPLLHSCSLTVDLTQNPFQHLTDQPILDPDTPHWFIDGSSQKSHPLQQDMPSSRHITFVTITEPRQLKLHLLPLHTTSQQAELIALTKALTLAKNLRVNIHTDSKYACNILHANILIWRERGFLNQKGSPTINSDLIHRLPRGSTLTRQSRHPPL